jgi:hypothetical protein
MVCSSPTEENLFEYANNVTGEKLMPNKRSIRILKHLRSVPAVAICTFCSQQFKAPLSTLSRVTDATASLQQQFDRHKCQRIDTSQANAPR